MPSRLTSFSNRSRATAFGGAARNYDRHRPRYPRQMIDDLLADGARHVLDVGAGTGIASQQLAEAGADVLALEPDARMAAVAQEKGINTEITTFENWESAGRTFDLVVFAASFYWVDPAVALPKARDILRTGGKLALLWNRAVPTRPTREDFDAIYSDYMDADSRAMYVDPEPATVALHEGGFVVTQRVYTSDFHYSPQQWLDLMFTVSNHLVLPPDKATELRARLADRIGSDGVSVRTDAFAVLAAPS
jgi:SAM-dependent methyltransferase